METRSVIGRAPANRAGAPLQRAAPGRRSLPDVTRVAFTLVLAIAIDALAVEPVAPQAPRFTHAFSIPADSASPDVEFYRISDVILSPDGSRVYVADNLDTSIRVFSRDGQLLRQFGRRGAGPGDFGGPIRMEIVDGQLKVQDIGNRRTAWYTLDGEYLTDRNDPPLEQGTPRTAWPAYHVRHEQLILVTASRFSPTAGSAPDISVRYMLASSSGQVLDTIGEYHGGSAYAEIRGQSRFMPAGGAFGRGGLVEVGGDSMVVQLDAYRGTVQWSLIERGRLEMIATRELGWTPLPVDKSLDLEMRRGTPYGGDPDDLVVVYPTYESRVRGTIAVVAPNGDLWVRARTWSGALATPFDGEYILIPFSSLRSPTNVTLKGFTLKHVYDDLLVGVQRDDLGVETVRAYRIHWN